MTERGEREEHEARLQHATQAVTRKFGINGDVLERASNTAREVSLQLHERGGEPTGVHLFNNDDDEMSFRETLALSEILYTLHPSMRPEASRDNLTVIPHFDQLDAVVDRLLAAQEKNAFPYNLDAAQLPQDERNMPPSLPRGGREHANFLWATCYYMRGGIKSTSAFRSLSKIYEQQPEVFDPEHACRMDPSDITALLVENGLAFSAENIGRYWVKNAHRMLGFYDGDPRNIFDEVSSYEQVLKRVRSTPNSGFAGFQKKMSSMISYYLMDAELIPYFDFPLPVDFHVLRVSAATEIITFENAPDDNDIYSEKTLDMLRALYHDYSVTHGVSQLDVCNAVWLLSSAICGSQPGNIMLEPGDRNRRNGRKTHIVPMPIDTSNPRQLRMYEKSCAPCPVEEVCEFNMPSKAYYVAGKALLSPRVRFERDDVLFPLANLYRVDA